MEVDELRRERDEFRDELLRVKMQRILSVVFAHHKGAPRPFALYRREDMSGVSGTGVVALGAQWPDGTVVLRWLGERPATAVWDSLENVEAVHGHGGRTEVVWLSDELESLAEMERQRDEARTALADLVALHDGPRGATYTARKPAAWAAARAALGLPTADTESRDS